MGPPGGAFKHSCAGVPFELAWELARLPQNTDHVPSFNAEQTSLCSGRQHDPSIPGTPLTSLLGLPRSPWNSPQVYNPLEPWGAVSGAAGLWTGRELSSGLASAGPGGSAGGTAKPSGWDS